MIRVFIGIVLFITVGGCGITANDAVKVTNVSGAILEAADDSLAKAVEVSTSGGETQPSEALLKANEALQEARSEHQLLHLGAEIWLASDDPNFWFEQAPCMANKLLDLGKSYNAANVELSLPITHGVSLLRSLSRGACSP